MPRRGREERTESERRQARWADDSQTSLKALASEQLKSAARQSNTSHILLHRPLHRLSNPQPPVSLHDLSHSQRQFTLSRRSNKNPHAHTHTFTTRSCLPTRLPRPPRPREVSTQLQPLRSPEVVSLTAISPISRMHNLPTMAFRRRRFQQARRSSV